MPKKRKPSPKKKLKRSFSPKPKRVGSKKISLLLTEATPSPDPITQSPSPSLA